MGEMGACASRPKGCSFGFKKKKKNDGGARRRRRVIPRRVSSASDRSHSVPTHQGSMDASFFDANSAIESERDDEFYSVHDDVMSLHESESASTLSVSSPRGLSRLALKPPPLHSTSAVSAEVTVDEIGGGDKMQGLDHCWILQTSCLPCLPSTSNSPLGDKRITPAAPSLRRKVLSFKWREGHSASAAAAADSTPTLQRLRKDHLPVLQFRTVPLRREFQIVGHLSSQIHSKSGVKIILGIKRKKLLRAALHFILSPLIFSYLRKRLITLLVLWNFQL